jgi:hypothetical protein
VGIHTRRQGTAEGSGRFRLNCCLDPHTESTAEESGRFRLNCCVDPHTETGYSGGVGKVQAELLLCASTHGDRVQLRSREGSG